MKSLKKPTPKQIDRTLALISRLEHYRYFFDRLENPEWIVLLRDKGFFQNPPSPIRDDSKGIINFPPWPESRYLARMASMRPEIIIDISNGIKTDNIRVHDDFIDAALAMPADCSAKMVPIIDLWIGSPYKLLLPGKSGSLISHLAQGGQTEAGLALARKLLDIPLHFDSWQYGEILKNNIPELVRAYGKPTFLMLLNLLKKSINNSSDLEKGIVTEDHSYYWRPAIEAHEQNGRPNETKEMLVPAIRDAAEQILKDDPTQITDLTKLLEDHKWKIFYRIALHLLRCFPDAAKNIIAEHLTNKEYFDEIDLRHEYFLLLHDQFSKLSFSQQEIILQWINIGPNLEKLKMQGTSQGQFPSEEEVDNFVKNWKLVRLSPIKDTLPQDWKEYYDYLMTEIGEPFHPDFPVYMSGIYEGPTSPKNIDDLSKMSVGELVSFTKSWKSDSNIFFAPTPEGLGREITTLVASSPEKFVAQTEQIKELYPIYICSFIAGLRNATKQNRAFSWMPTLELCLWVLNQPRDVKNINSEMESDPNCSWTSKVIVELLGTGLEASGECAIPFELRSIVWEVLQPLTEDIEPTPEYEERYGGSNMDPATLSINTVRGEAMHTVIRYGLWIRRYHEKMIDGQNRINNGFDEMPEVRDVLECHLEVHKDPAISIHAVYGQWFPWLVLLDKQWVINNQKKIFPKENSLIEFYDAAWITYITFCPPYENVLVILNNEYRREIANINLVNNKKSILIVDYRLRLVEHLAVFYWRGLLNLDEPDGLLSYFYSLAPDELRGHLISFIGQCLYNTPDTDTISPKTIDLLQKLWINRLEIATIPSSQGVFDNELSAFGFWFASGKFENKWSMTQLEEVLRQTAHIEMDHLVVKKLTELAPIMPLQSIGCLKIIIEENDEWAALRCREDAYKIISIVMQSNVVEAKQKATALINLYGSKYDDLGFRDLL